MAVVTILTIPDPTLFEKSQEVKTIDSTVKEIIQNMRNTLDSAEEPEGAGLAAPQIGVLERIVVARRFIPNPENPEETRIKEYVLVNPRITKLSKETDVAYEGCLSVPDTYGQVERAKKIKVEALNETGKPIKIQTSGFFARVIQHEIDHLDGILFTSKVIGDTITSDELEDIQKPRL